MNNAKDVMSLIGVGITIGAILVIVFVFLVGATPSGIKVGPIEFDLPTKMPTALSPTISAPLNNADKEIVVSGSVWSNDISEPNIYAIRPVSDLILANFTVEVKVRINDDSSEYQGVMFRQTKEGNFYSFRITQDGFYAFDKWETNGEDGASHESLLGPSISPAIKKGKGEINHLRVIAHGPRFELYINDQKVGTITDNSYTDGKVGLVSCTCDGSSAASVQFSDFMADTEK